MFNDEFFPTPPGVIHKMLSKVSPDARHSSNRVPARATSRMRSSPAHVTVTLPWTASKSIRSWLPSSSARAIPSSASTGWITAASVITMPSSSIPLTRMGTIICCERGTSCITARSFVVRWARTVRPRIIALEIEKGQLIDALEALIARSDDLHSAIEGVTDQFEPEVAALSAATTAAEAIIKKARGQQ